MIDAALDPESVNAPNAGIVVDPVNVGRDAAAEIMKSLNVKSMTEIVEMKINVAIEIVIGVNGKEAKEEKRMIASVDGLVHVIRNENVINVTKKGIAVKGKNVNPNFVTVKLKLRKNLSMVMIFF